MKPKFNKIAFGFTLLTLIVTYPEKNYAAWGFGGLKSLFGMGDSSASDKATIDSMLINDETFFGSTLTDQGSVYLGIHSFDEVERYFEMGPRYLNNPVDGYGVRTVKTFIYALERAVQNAPMFGGIVIEYKLKKESHPRVLDWASLHGTKIGENFFKEYQTQNRIMQALKEKFGIQVIIESGKIYILDLSIVDRPMDLLSATNEMYHKMNNETSPRARDLIRYYGGKRFYDILATHVQLGSTTLLDASSCANVYFFNK